MRNKSQTNVVTNAGRYDNAFFDRMDEAAMSSASVLVPLVIELVRPASVVDVGCGRGAWLNEFHSNGVSDILGLDGSYLNPQTLLIPSGSFKCVDLNAPPELDEKFDLAVSLEVAEHLPRASARAFVKMLTGLAPIVLFSAALPGQGGTDHRNEAWPNFWKELFASHGFTRLDPLRRLVWQDCRVEWYYQQNIYLFVSDLAMEKNQRLRDESCRGEDTPLVLVHEKIVGRMQSFRGVLSLLFPLLLAAIRRRFGIRD